MLRKRAALAALVALGLGVLVAPPAAMGDAQTAGAIAAQTAGENCEDSPQGGGASVDCSTGGETDPDGEDYFDPDDGGGSGTRVCETTDGHGGTREVDCVTDDGTWHSGHMCYLKALEPQPGQSDAVWEGNTDGVIVACTPPPCTGFCRDYAEFWMATAPEDVGPTPQELAERAVARMTLETGAIGSTPPSTEDKPGSMGLIGVPMWFWIDDRGPGTTDDLTVSETEGSLTVTITGVLDRVEWTLTDRSTGAFRASVTCTGTNGAGTEWSDAEDGDGSQPSPTCGLPASRNEQPGRYTLTAQAFWDANWNGAGESGTIPVTSPPQSVPIDIAELQTIVVD